MKKFLLLIPLFMFPYIYLPYIAVCLVVPYLADTLTAQSELTASLDTVSTVLMDTFLIIPLVYTVATLICCTIHTILCARGKYTAYEAAKLNMIVRCVHIPAYIFHFVMGAIGACMSIWGIGFLMFAILIDFLTIMLSGISSVGVHIRIAKEKVFPIWAAILMGIGSFVYIADVVIAFVYFFRTKKFSQIHTSQISPLPPAPATYDVL